MSSSDEPNLKAFVKILNFMKELANAFGTEFPQVAKYYALCKKTTMDNTTAINKQNGIFSAYCESNKDAIKNANASALSEACGSGIPCLSDDKWLTCRRGHRHAVESGSNTWGWYLDKTEDSLQESISHEVVNPTISELLYCLNKEYNLVLNKCKELEVESQGWGYHKRIRVKLLRALDDTKEYGSKLQEYIKRLKTLNIVGLYFVRDDSKIKMLKILHKKEKLVVDSTLGIYCAHISYRVHQIMYKHGYISQSLYADIKSQMKRLKRKTLHFMKQNM